VVVVPFTELSGRLAVVTGAGSGIGRELVAQLAAAGAHVAACDVRLAAVRNTRAAVVRRWPNSQITAHECDVSDPEAVARFASEVAESHHTDQVHVLVNNAGVVGGGSFVADDPLEWERTFAVNWTGTYLCTRTFLPMLLASDQGVVVNVASVNALWASLGPGTAHTAYSASKFAVRGFTEALIGDFAAHAPHLSAVLVLPGHVRTAMPAPPPAWRRSFSSALKAVKPTSAADAATQILDGLRAGHWRILIGDDARNVDQLVRADPWTAYP
jgi:NAD(P)-dependent dehydrogenase (short-subunit alcohol dehydrogenase family)